MILGNWNHYLHVFIKICLTILLLLFIDTDYSPYFFAYMGVASALVFANLGASYGTAKSGVGIASLGVIDSSKVFKSLIPIIMAGILGIYGIIIAVLLVTLIPETGLTGRQGFKILGAGLCCGLSALASGLAIGVAGDAGVRAYAQTDGIFVGMILILIFAEAIGLYGLIVAIILYASQ
jgi:V-type H+-transporting ATPase proteolipid subunit